VKTVAVILAASEERSMGHPTALLHHEGGKSFLQSLASTFGKAGCASLGVVGDAGEQVREQHPALALVEAAGWREKPGAALRAGVRAALEEGADVVLLHPVDMPAVRPGTLKSLLGKVEGADALRPTFESAPGFPVLLSRAAAERLLNADEAKSPEATLAGVPAKSVAVKDPGVVVRIRSADLYTRLFDRAPELAPPPKRRGRRGAASEGDAGEQSAASDK
jgi:molybdenum cofactor cytidylyltransferase